MRFLGEGHSAFGDKSLILRSVLGHYLSGNDPKCFSLLPHLSRKRSFFRKAELPKG